jgi:hypothetical protein
MAGDYPEDLRVHDKLAVERWLNEGGHVAAEAVIEDAMTDEKAGRQPGLPAGVGMACRKRSGREASAKRAHGRGQPTVTEACGRDEDRVTGRVHSLFAGCASLWLAAALIASVARTIEPFAHGTWLVAYLFLVGFLAQLLLARGQATVRAAAPSDADGPPISAQVTCWNAGVVTVPLGVLADARAFVVLGSVALLTALVAFWRASRPRRSESGATSGGAGAGYLALVLFMAASVLIGTALAWDIPWL